MAVSGFSIPVIQRRKLSLLLPSTESGLGWQSLGGLPEPGDAGTAADGAEIVLPPQHEACRALGGCCAGAGRSPELRNRELH